ncbi:hypothetical protein KQX54_021527 [Cotesia glomerata]|uniref:Uncharacterized protein n=1 Tax=Cotesia glomerata TaxID=32391 RepID=A0AAV7J7E8_COTGL|nr:hypothetical protein KQX54_021527 [Cotesia glomerata]
MYTQGPWSPYGQQPEVCVHLDACRCLACALVEPYVPRCGLGQILRAKRVPKELSTLSSYIPFEHLFKVEVKAQLGIRDLVSINPCRPPHVDTYQIAF